MTEAQIRVALDEVRALSGDDPVATSRNRDILQKVLRMPKVYRAEGEGNATPKQPTPHAPAQQVPQRSGHQEQVPLFAPVEEESSETSSDSESESDSRSDSTDKEPGGEDV